LLSIILNSEIKTFISNQSFNFANNFAQNDRQPLPRQGLGTAFYAQECLTLVFKRIGNTFASKWSKLAKKNV
jgi:hypothetical protein